MLAARAILLGEDRFNPLPLPKQGEICICCGPGVLWFRFNPLPLPKQGEISTSGLLDAREACFNPLPLPKQGEIRIG